MKQTARLIIGILAAISLSLPLAAADCKKGEVIVKFKASSHLNKSSSMAGEESDRPVIVAVEDTETAVREIKARDDVEYAEPNYIIEAEEVPGDWPYAANQWADAELPLAWDLISQNGPGEEVIIAVIDSGVDTDHPDLAANLASGYDFANNDLLPEDDAGHGTRVCGVIGALGNNGIGVAGIAWNIDIQIMPLKFMKLNDGKTTGAVSDATNAIYYAVDHGADIINASWGFTSYSQALYDAIQYARDNGVLFVCSAGNTGEDNDTTEHYPSNYTHDNIIAVAALNSYGQLASFSNYGRTSVDIAAPGVGLTSTDMGGGIIQYISGTSYATPFTAAIAALVKSQSPGITCTDLRSIVISSAADSKGTELTNIASGGCVNAYQALMAQEAYNFPAGDTTGSGSTGGTTPAQQVAGGEGGGGGGGCMIDASQNPGIGIVLLILTTLAVLFRMPRTRSLE